MNTNQPRVTAKKLEVYLKQPKTAKEIAQKLGFNSVKELDEAMKKTFPSQRYEYYRSRLAKKTSSKKSSKKKATVEVHEPEFIEPKDEDTRPTLEELRQLEEDQQAATIESEVAVKAIRQRAKENLKSIQALKDKVDGWLVLINEALAQIDTLEDQSIDILADHEEALADLHEKQKTLKEIRDEIEERSVIFILVDGKAGIDAEMDGKPFELSFGDWRSIYDDILSRDPEELGDLRVSDMIQVAKVLSLPDDAVYDITFESEHMEELYKSMRSAN